jgi:hypothetical protein
MCIPGSVYSEQWWLVVIESLKQEFETTHHCPPTPWESTMEMGINIISD